MIGEIVLVILLGVTAVRLYKNAYKKPANFPPGPPSLPVYGAYWLVLAKAYNNLAAACIKFSNEYKSKVIGMILGTIPVVVVNDPYLLKEVLNREEFDGRMDIILGRLRSYWKKLGIFFTDGYFWHVQRRFTLRYMRDYGFGRRDESLESTVAHEVKEMIDMATNGPKYPAENDLVKGDQIYLPHFFAVPFMNGLMHVFTRACVPRQDYHILWTTARGALRFQRSSNDFGAALSFTPWLKDFLPEFSGYKGLKEGNQCILDLFTKIIKEALDTHDSSFNRHFLDVYISKMKEEMAEKKRTTYSVDQLALVCTDYMFPTASALQSVLSLLIERLLLHPEVQDKIHEEIDRVIGRDRLPTIDDRSNMPYTEACLREIMRIETLVPLGVPHRAMVDTKLDGYNIPEGSMVSLNYVTLHMNKEIWGDPENFRPERFIVNGRLQLSQDKSLPFGAGRRLCAGETYARQALFQVFAAFMQAFQVSTIDGKPYKQLAPRIQGIITTIPNFWIRVTPRK
ncbi:putative cytochrome P450 304a1 [Papilio machaon]|uniref:Putative cytochrome P450 304a1 n=1 Tax=Papilio machaon TaxID=76193 RepID=A0A194RMB5_PAPMA|nr:putative cytochrome P450 304a1 [Papilio machaon]